MLIGVPREILPGERRVATTPAVVNDLVKLGYNVAVEKGAGVAASFNDEDYSAAGARIESDTRKLWEDAGIIIKVRAPAPHPDLEIDETELLTTGKILVSFIWPAQNEDLMKRLAGRGATVCAMDAVPRISRAQKLDALSSMANVAGYRAVVEAASHFGRFFTGQVTAAGKVPPAKVLVIGAGVAGLSAIGAAGSLGAVVRAFDTRLEVKEQVESMGAEFLVLDFEDEEEGSGSGGYAKQMSDEFIKAEMDLFRKQAGEVDIIITTALIPGKPAPKLITADMVESMKPGSVIVDLAGEQGGNCELTEPGEVVVRNDVTIIGYTDLVSRLPTQSSQLYATNIRHLIAELTTQKDGNPDVNMEDEVIRGLTVVKDGEITWPPPEPRISAAPKPAARPAEAAPKAAEKKSGKPRAWVSLALVAAGAAAILGLGSVAPADFMQHFTVFVLAIFVGYQVIWSVTPALHTPLMSVTNAISSIVILGALLQIGSGAALVSVLAAVAILITTINMFGGFLVTQRMLKMFRK